MRTRNADAGAATVVGVDTDNSDSKVFLHCCSA